METRFRIDGNTVDYYNAVVDSFGLQFGPQTKAIALTFLVEKAKFANLNKR